MIAAKTRMKKMPETCKQCALSLVEHDLRCAYRVEF